MPLASSSLGPWFMSRCRSVERALANEVGREKGTGVVCRVLNPYAMGFALGSHVCIDRNVLTKPDTFIMHDRVTQQYIDSKAVCENRVSCQISNRACGNFDQQLVRN